jgi:hypothetical protein
MLIIAPARESENSLPFAPIIHGLRRHVPEEVLIGDRYGLGKPVNAFTA